MFSWRLLRGGGFGQGRRLLVEVAKEVIQRFVDLDVHIHDDVGFHVDATGCGDQGQQHSEEPGAFHGSGDRGFIDQTQFLFYWKSNRIFPFRPRFMKPSRGTLTLKSKVNGPWCGWFAGTPVTRISAECPAADPAGCSAILSSLTSSSSWPASILSLIHI